MDERLRRMDDERIAKLETKVETWMETTTEYRRALCAKLDKVLEKLNSLPCERGEEHSRHVDKQLVAIWTFVTFLTVSALGGAVVWGGVAKQVDVNTDRWDRFLKQQEAKDGEMSETIRMPYLPNNTTQIAKSTR